MKRLILGLALGVLLAGGTSPALAHDAYDDSESNPLRLAAYAIYPVGWFLEWTVTRPIHFVTSNPTLEPIFGHVPHDSPYGNYAPYEPSMEPPPPAPLPPAARVEPPPPLAPPPPPATQRRGG